MLLREGVIMKKVIIITMASLFLMACSDSGGGASSGGSSVGGSTPDAGGAGSDASPSPIDQPVTVKTQDLVAPEGFSFNPVESQRLVVNLSGSLPARAHLSVYSSFTENAEGGFSVDHGSKVIDVPVVNGVADIEFSIADNMATSIAEIWLYDGSSPLQREFTIDGSEWEWN
ncbi:hypothetical protein A6E04_11910 [Aliivibrio logei]|jgi:hypothetical protein|uniref:Lipoprotein n=2 Tax=Aliivibrio logei TaxID=688 RepID=A0A1B9NZ41_ALILO|nr:hypothetical protein A6E04_11910 [Aliivibrio logei]